MGKEWMSIFLSQRDARREDAQRKVELDSLALAGIPSMFKRLCEQIKSDIEQYNAAPGTHRQFGIKDRDSEHAIEASTSDFPVVWLRLERQRTDIRMIVSTKKSSSAPNPRDEKTILIVATGVDELYYRLDGADCASESEMSEHILRPLLDLL